MSNLTLYEITGQLKATIDYLESLDELGTDLDHMQDVLHELSRELQHKSAGIIGYIRNVDLTIDAMKAEEKRIKENRQQLENRLQRFKDYIKKSKELIELTKVETTSGTISLAKNPVSCDVLDITQVPKEYKNTVITETVDKKQVIKDFKDTGIIPDGIQINAYNTSVRIK